MTEENRNLQRQGEATGEAGAPSLASQGAVVSGMTMLSRISGLIRDVFFAYLLGASQFADMFLVAFRIPNFFRRMFAEGAFNQAFVPVMTRYRLQGQAALLTFLSPLVGLFSTSLVLFVSLGLVFVDELTFIFAFGFADHPGRLEQTADLVVLTLPYLAFISLTAYAGALLNAHGRFAVPAFTPVLLNLVLICAALASLSGSLGLLHVEVLAWGVLVAGLVQFLFQLPSLGRLGLIVRPNLDYRHPGIGRLGKLLLPALFASSVSQINALISTMLASTLITGSISWLYYADRLLELPIGLVAIALSTVMLPHLSRLAATSNNSAFKQTLGWGINLGFMLGLPAAAALYLLAEGLIATLFLTIGGSAMTVHDARMASYALELFAVALPGFVLVRVLSPAFYAHEDTQTPFRYAAVAVLANIVAALATFSWFGHVGLAWATAISAWVNVVLLYRGLTQRGWFSLDASLWRLFWRVVVASSVLVLALLTWAVPLPWFDMSGLERVVTMTIVAGGGVLGYGLLLFVLGVRRADLRHDSVVSQAD